jgi:hypothetical protein
LASCCRISAGQEPDACAALVVAETARSRFCQPVHRRLIAAQRRARFGHDELGFAANSLKAFVRGQ